ncbi:MAG TPA: A24 family peptidase [Syntrophales bacterium]|nr:A24 family peptidase [Syntrophales bacterium]
MEGIDWSIMETFLVIFFTCLGAAIGSFLNVCIVRLHVEEKPIVSLPSHCPKCGHPITVNDDMPIVPHLKWQSIAFPPSHCPKCSHPIRFYDNIPVVSYFLLRGKCRDCGEPISARYPFVEALTAAVALLLFGKFGLSLAFLATFLFVCTLIVITFIDIDHKIIPDTITLSGIPIFMLASVLCTHVTLLEAFLGMMIGASTLYFVAVYYEAITGVEGMGGGDVTLLAMLGAFLGWKSLLFILFVGSLIGAVVGVTLMIIKRQNMKYAVPFGPFLSAAAVLYIFFGAAFNVFLDALLFQY